MKITFRKQRPATGLSDVGHPYPSTDIKVDGKVVGHITAPNWQVADNKWTVNLAVKRQSTERNLCEWRWVRVKKRFHTEPDARVHIIKQLERILKVHQLELHYFEEDY